MTMSEIAVGVATAVVFWDFARPLSPFTDRGRFLLDPAVLGIASALAIPISFADISVAVVVLRLAIWLFLKSAFDFATTLSA